MHRWLWRRGDAERLESGCCRTCPDTWHVRHCREAAALGDAGPDPRPGRGRSTLLTRVGTSQARQSSRAIGHDVRPAASLEPVRRCTHGSKRRWMHGKEQDVSVSSRRSLVRARHGWEPKRCTGERRAGGKVLVVVPTTALLHQWRNGLRDTSALAGTAVGLMGDGNTSSFTTRDVIVSTIHSAKNLRPPTRGLIIADECHRYGSGSWSRSTSPAIRHGSD